MLDAAQVRAALKRHSAAPGKIFGAEGHCFVLNPPVPEADVVAFERRHRITLPGDYRHFLTHIGNGGAGPYYGVFPLGQTDGNSGKLEEWREGDGFVGILAQPFPHSQAWNDLTEEPSSEVLEKNEDEYWRRMDAFEKNYWSSSVVNGAIPICHMGCALRVWLVVTGEEAGHLWRDGRADNTGLCPLLLRHGSRATFASWYAEWLNDPLVIPQGKP